MTLKILALGDDGIDTEVVHAPLELGGTLSTDDMSDAVIEQFHAL